MKHQLLDLGPISSTRIRYRSVNYLIGFRTPDIFLLSNRLAIIRVIVRVLIHRPHFGINEDE